MIRIEFRMVIAQMIIIGIMKIMGNNFLLNIC
jgi:hypothetical protein